MIRLRLDSVREIKVEKEEQKRVRSGCDSVSKLEGSVAGKREITGAGGKYEPGRAIKNSGGKSGRYSLVERERERN